MPNREYKFRGRARNQMGRENVWSSVVWSTYTHSNAPGAPEVGAVSESVIKGTITVSALNGNPIGDMGSEETQFRVEMRKVTDGDWGLGVTRYVTGGITLSFVESDGIWGSI